VRRHEVGCAVGRVPGAARSARRRPRTQAGTPVVPATPKTEDQHSRTRRPRGSRPATSCVPMSQRRGRSRYQHRGQNRRGAQRPRLHATEVEVIKKWAQRPFVNPRRHVLASPVRHGGAELDLLFVMGTDGVFVPGSTDAAHVHVLVQGLEAEVNIVAHRTLGPTRRPFSACGPASPDPRHRRRRPQC
jgi:hypothetical protein